MTAVAGCTGSTASWSSSCWPRWTTWRSGWCRRCTARSPTPSASARARSALVTAVSFLVSAVAAVGWAYVGDRTDRKPLLMVGTLLWAAGHRAVPALAGSYPTFLAAQMVAAVGLGAVGSVGFSVVSDLISPRRRGLVMSFWGLSQGVGTLAGTLVGGLLGARRLAAAVPGAGRRRAGRRPWPTCSLRHPARAERAGTGRRDRRRRRVRLPDQPRRPAGDPRAGGPTSG